MKYLLLILVIVATFPNIGFADIKNPVAFIGQAVLGATVGAPLAVDANGLLVSGLTSTEVSATADATTTSTTDVLMTSMTITPAAGTYKIAFSTCVDHSAQSVAVVMSIYIGGTLQAESVRAPVPRFNALGANSLNPCVSINGIEVVNGSQAIEIRWKTASGTATAHQRTLDIVRLQ